jgi:hypothetical protein
MRGSAHSIVWLVIATSSLHAWLPGQELQSGLAPTLPSASAAAYYYIAKPGELTMQVNVWGFVGKPGRYEVPTSTDLIQLISFAGGPVQYADMGEIVITRIARSDSGQHRRELVIDLRHLAGRDGSELALYPGDTVFIDHTSWLTVRDVFSVVTTAAIITSAIAQILWASR